MHPCERERKYRRKKERKDNELWISFKRDIAPWPPYSFSFLSSSPPSPLSLSFSLCPLPPLKSIRADCHGSVACMHQAGLQQRSAVSPRALCGGDNSLLSQTTLLGFQFNSNIHLRLTWDDTKERNIGYI